MATHKLLLDNHYGYDFTLIAIHTALEAYQTAFLLNKSLGIHLSRSKEDLRLHRKKYQVDFSLYEYKNAQSHIKYHLLNNRTKLSVQEEVPGLFYDQEAIAVNETFITDLPKVDYLLKVYDEGNAFAKAQTIKTIKSIPQIITVYTVEIESLKTKQNLIFE